MFGCKVSGPALLVRNQRSRAAPMAYPPMAYPMCRLCEDATVLAGTLHDKMALRLAFAGPTATNHELIQGGWSRASSLKRSIRSSDSKSGRSAGSSG